MHQERPAAHASERHLGVVRARVSAVLGARSVVVRRTEGHAAVCAGSAVLRHRLDVGANAAQALDRPALPVAAGRATRPVRRGAVLPDGGRGAGACAARRGVHRVSFAERADGRTVVMKNEERLYGERQIVAFFSGVKKIFSVGNTTMDPAIKDLLVSLTRGLWQRTKHVVAESDGYKVTIGPFRISIRYPATTELEQNDRDLNRQALEQWIIIFLPALVIHGMYAVQANELDVTEFVHDPATQESVRSFSSDDWMNLIFNWKEYLEHEVNANRTGFGYKKATEEPWQPTYNVQRNYAFMYDFFADEVHLATLKSHRGKFRIDVGMKELIPDEVHKLRAMPAPTRLIAELADTPNRNLVMAHCATDSLATCVETQIRLELPNVN